MNQIKIQDWPSDNFQIYHRFEAQRYLSTPERVDLATALNLSETQVGWFLA